MHDIQKRTRVGLGLRVGNRAIDCGNCKVDGLFGVAGNRRLIWRAW